MIKIILYILSAPWVILEYSQYKNTRDCPIDFIGFWTVFTKIQFSLEGDISYRKYTPEQYLDCKNFCEDVLEKP